ncbi:zinc finger MYM-type protein 1-like [Xyrauchen texanus]|uniref:zinc finger MYM-type protein 1-like n=1 Tax=Xyrauchen texanus TaxID=154827 RepID=UPI0022426F35|nr:zinc finger MYM-type protein 1-like [Xyrauchen texanus]
MLAVVREHIVEEVKSANFVAIQADETTDVSTQTQLVLVLRYIDPNNKVQERFFEFLPISESTSISIAIVLLERLNGLFADDEKVKLIAQAYDGASVMRGEKAGVQQKVREHFKNAHYVHCYAHQLNLIMQQATSRIKTVNIFFSDLSGIATFFSRSPKRTSILDQTVARRLPRASSTRWNFNSRVVNTVYENRDDLIQCFEAIRTGSLGSFDQPTVREASGYVRMLHDEDFIFFLWLFHKIMPHVDTLYQKLQKKDIDAVFIKRALDSFTNSVQAIRDSSQQQLQVATGARRPRTSLREEEKQRLSEEVCDTILEARFSFTVHLVSATLLLADMFERYCHSFPDEALNAAVNAYPMLNKAKLKTELSLIYENPEFKGCCGALALYQVLMSYNLQETFSETVTLLNILITTPMTTAEAERCFSTLTRVKTFLRNSMGQERLNALAMLSMERELVLNMPDFNEKVIDRFAALKERRAQFQYK